MTIPVLIEIISDDDFGPDTVSLHVYIYIFQILMHIILEIQISKQRSYVCGKTASSLSKLRSRQCKHNFQMDDFFYYYNYYHFHDPSTLLTENNTMIII